MSNVCYHISAGFPDEMSPLVVGTESLKTLVRALVVLLADYCNLALASAPGKFQRVLNCHSALDLQHWQERRHSYFTMICTGWTYHN